MSAAVDDQRFEVAVGLHAREQRVREAHVERLLDPERQLEQVEPANGQVAGQRVAGGKLRGCHADGVGDDRVVDAASHRGSAPSVGHVFVINLENKSFRTTWGAQSAAPYLARTLRGQLARSPSIATR